MARIAQSVVSAYAPVVIPTDVFTTVNLQPNKDLGVTSYDNAELTQVLSDVYHYAQQSVSFLRPLLPNASDISAQFISKNTFGKMQLHAKQEEAGFTPLHTPSTGTRAYSAGLWDQGVLIDRDVDNMTQYSLTAHSQMELAKAVGRCYDQSIVEALTASVLVYSSEAAKGFQGVKTASSTAFPEAQKYIYASVAGSTITYKDVDVDLFDDLVLEFEKSSIAPENLLIIGTPSLRRKLKKVSEFRDTEKTIAYGGNENLRMFEWLGYRFVFLGPEILIKKSLITGSRVDADGGSAVASGGTVVGANDGFENFIVADLSGLIWGDYTKANEMLTADRDDLSHAKQMYMKVGFGGMRIDDNKVRIVAVKA